MQLILIKSKIVIFFTKRIFFINLDKWYKQVLLYIYSNIWRNFVVGVKRPNYSKRFCPHYRMYRVKVFIIKILASVSFFYKKLEYFYITKINVSYRNNKMCFFYTIWLFIIFFPMFIFSLFNINLLYFIFLLCTYINAYILNIHNMYLFICIYIYGIVFYSIFVVGFRKTLSSLFYLNATQNTRNKVFFINKNAFFYFLKKNFFFNKNAFLSIKKESYLYEVISCFSIN